jgi:hypothetical protein
MSYQPKNHTAMLIGAQLLHVVYEELRHTPAREVGAALSIVVASTPDEVRRAFELNYAHDRLAADLRLGIGGR